MSFTADRHFDCVIGEGILVFGMALNSFWRETMPAEVIRPPNPSSKTTKVSARAPVDKTKQTHKVTKTGRK